MRAVTVFLLAVGFVIGIILGVLWVIWSLWCYVLPALWPTGPAALVHPSYWFFAAMWLLAGFIAGLFKAGEQKEKP